MARKTGLAFLFSLMAVVALGAANVQELWLVTPAAVNGRGIEFLDSAAAGNTHGVDELIVLGGTANNSTVEVRAASNGALLSSFLMPGTGDATLPLYKIAASDDGVIFANGFAGSVMACLDDLGTTPTKVINQTGGTTASRCLDVVGSVALGNCTVFVSKTNLLVQVWRQTGVDANGLPTFGGAADATIDTTAQFVAGQTLAAIEAVDDSAFLCVTQTGSPAQTIKKYVKSGATYTFDSALGQYSGFVKTGLAWNGGNIYAMGEAGGTQDGFAIATVSPNANISPAAGLDGDADNVYDAAATDLNVSSAVVDVCMDPTTRIVYGYSGSAGTNGGYFAIQALDSDPALTINEFAWDDPSTDNNEFVELYNPSDVDALIGGWAVQAGDGAPTPIDFTYTIPGGTKLGPKDYYVIGNATVPNVDQTFAVNGLQNDMEWIRLKDATNAQRDFVLYEANKLTVGVPPAPDGVTTITLEGVGIWSNGTDVDPNGLAYGRFPDGTDTNVNAADFVLLKLSPGATNSPTTATLPYANNFDEADGTTYAAIVGNYVGLSAQNPAVGDLVGAGSVNPSVIPASPQGGNVGIMWDASGGGDVALISQIAPVQNVSIECYVYIDSTVLPANEYNSSTFFNIRGTVDNVYNTPDIPTFTANGNEGLFVVYTSNNGQGAEVAQRVRLIEKTSGVETVLGTIPVSTGVNDGWQRLYLNANGADVALILGGTYGDVNSGTLVKATTSIVRGGNISMGFREGMATHQNTRPPTYDALLIDVADTLPANLAVNDWSLF